jgi:MAM domain.
VVGPKQLGSTVSGSYDLVTGAKAGWDAGSNDIDNGQTSIKSPLITLPANSNLTLTFSYYFAHAKNSSNADYFRVKIVGTSTTTILQELGKNKNRDAYWKTATINLNDFAGQTVYILIEAADKANESLVEAGVDDVKIVANPRIFTGGDTITIK